MTKPPLFDVKKAQIAACHGVYSANATARYFGVSWSYVRSIWNGPELPEVEPPNIWGARPLPDLLDTDVVILRARGFSLDEIAKELGMSPRWVDKRLQILREKGTPV